VKRQGRVTSKPLPLVHPSVMMLFVVALVVASCNLARCFNILARRFF